MKERNIREQVAQDICTACGKIYPDECEYCTVRINLKSLTDKVCQSFKEEVEKVKGENPYHHENSYGTWETAPESGVWREVCDRILKRLEGE